MSLVQITKPLIILVSLVSVGSFFIGNNLVPNANKKLFSTLYDIRSRNRPRIPGRLFFNGIDNMSIRVSHQEPDTHLLHDVLIYDNRAANGNMNTIVADSGYIRLSDDKKYLLVTLFHGETYEQTRNSQWFTQSALRHHTFDLQKQVIPCRDSPWDAPTPTSFTSSQTKNISELQHDIDSLEIKVNAATTSSYEPLLKEQIFARDNTVLPLPDSLQWTNGTSATCWRRIRSSMLPTARTRTCLEPGADAGQELAQHVRIRRIDGQEALNQLYRSKVEWHKKMSLPVSILIFFLIGAPLGAIIRKGGLGFRWWCR